MTTPTGPVVLSGRYRLGDHIGSGSMGSVWRATDELLGRTVAVKQLLLPPGADGAPERGPAYEEARQRILREGRLAARLQHPNTVVVFDVVLHDDLPWLVMEYVPSRTLSAVVATEGPLDPRRVAALGARVADGLAAAHAAGIVHRDIKPANVLIGTDGAVKITDFGVSRAADDVQLTRAGMIAGTPAYLAPEVARGQDPTTASDVFALGSTLYACVEGQPPFGLGENTYALLYSVGVGEVRSPERAGPLTAALMAMLDKDPARRPTAARARDELAAVAAGTVPAPPAPAAPAPAPVDQPTQAQPPPPRPASPPVGAARAAAPAAPSARADGRPDEYSARGTRVDLTASASAGQLPPPPRSPGGWQPLPASGPPGPPGPPGPERHRGRGRGRWIVLTVVALLLVAGSVFAVAGGGPFGGGLLGGGRPVPPSAQRPPASAEAPADTPSEAPASPSEAAPEDPERAEQLEAFVRDYYGLLPGDTEQAWELLGDQAREQSGSIEEYRAFYSTIGVISFAEGPTAVDDRTVRARIVFESTDGSVGAPEAYEFTVEPEGPDGALRLSSFSRG